MCQQRAAEELCERVSRSVGRPIRLGANCPRGIVPKGGKFPRFQADTVTPFGGRSVTGVAYIEELNRAETSAF